MQSLEQRRSVEALRGGERDRLARGAVGAVERREVERGLVEADGK